MFVNPLLKAVLAEFLGTLLFQLLGGGASIPAINGLILCAPPPLPQRQPHYCTTAQ